MRHLITTSFTTPTSPPSQSNIIKTQTLILPKPTSTAMNLLELRKVDNQEHRSRRQINRYDKYSRSSFDTNEIKQQAHCTPIIELKPIMGGSTITTHNIHSFTRENSETIIVRDSQNNELKKVTTIISGLNESPQHVSLNHHTFQFNFI